MRTITLNAEAYPTSTPELLALFNQLNATREALNKAMRGSRAVPFTLPEYTASMAAYRAYWKAVAVHNNLSAHNLDLAKGGAA